MSAVVLRFLSDCLLRFAYPVFMPVAFSIRALHRSLPSGMENWEVVRIARVSFSANT